MKKKSASQSAPARRSLEEGGFFKLRVLIGLFIVLASVFLTLAGLGTFSALTANSAQAQQKSKIIDVAGLPPGFDCATIHEKGIDKMENFRAGLIMIACGESQGGEPEEGLASSRNPLAKLGRELLPVPLAFGAADVNLITGTETFSSVTQSETYTTANPDNPNQLVVNYNDSKAAPGCYAGMSFSSDGGTTFTRLNPCPLCSGHGTNFGDPIVVYNKPTSSFFAMDLATGCGGQGIGTWKSTDGGATWSVSACAHNGGQDDRESAYADNTTTSPNFGRMYVSWNDFNVGGGALFVTYSSDNGATWHSPITVSNTGTFIRDVQITADKVTGDVYIAGMDEGGGGFPHNDTNKIFRSTDGGNTWTNTYTGSPFPGPGVTAVGYFAQMFSDGGGYWRHEGWGEPAAYNHVVSLVYSQHGTGADPGDVYYIRSTDSGVTFSAPFKLNTDATTRPQWQANLSVSDAGSLFATWYDARESASCTKSNPAVPCYRMFSRKSIDNGASWLPDDTLSDVVSPLPGQPDGNVQTTYAGDYDYGTAILTKHLTSWTDGRVTISNQSQQDAFTDSEIAGLSVTTTDPACNSVVFTQPTDFTVNVSIAVDPSTVQATDFTVNGTAANSFMLGAGNTQITFHFNNTPVTNQGVQTMHIPAGAFSSASSGLPVQEFQCTFRYDATLLQVTSTNPPVGGTFAGPATLTYDVNFNEPVDPNSISTGSLHLSGIAATVTNVQVMNNNMTAEFTINFTAVIGGTLTANIPAGAITDQFGNPNAAFSGDYQYTANFCDSGLVQNQGFETGSFSPWAIDGFSNPPVVTTNNPHSGSFSALAGLVTGSEPNGNSSFYQQFGPVPANAILSFWHWDHTTDTITFDSQNAYITNTNGVILQTIFHQCENGQTWLNTTVDMSSYAGQTVRVKFVVHQNGAGGNLTGMYVDDVVLATQCTAPSPTPTPTPRATPTPRPRPTPPPRP